MIFVFDNVTFDESTGEALFRYYFEGGLSFTERVQFVVQDEMYSRNALERALLLTFMLIGTSYYKTAPTSVVRFANHMIDAWQANFLNMVYQEGLSQFAFENNLTRTDLAHFTPTGAADASVAYDGSGILQLQSGGKDSLLTAALLSERNADTTSLYVGSSNSYPVVIDQLGIPIIVRRTIDRQALLLAKERGGRNGHVPVTYIALAIGVVQAVLSHKNTVIASIGHEGEEPHGWIADLPVNHQWSKTWQAEQLFAEYINRYVSQDIRVGSPLRQYSEVKVAELFADRAWAKFGHSFSSCNVANYSQGTDNTKLWWCGKCPKCANSYLLFAPFIASDELQLLFGGRDLFADLSLETTFKGLLGIEGVMKPFECIGEVEELRWVYAQACEQGYTKLSFAVPESDFKKERRYACQEWAARLITP